MTALVKHNGLWKEPRVIYIKDGGLWKEVSGMGYIPGMPMHGGFFGGFFTYGDGVVYALIIADKSAEQTLRWSTSSTGTSGADSSSDGWANSNVLNTPSYPAAEYCRQYDGGGFSDWYLGAPDEMIVVCETLNRSSLVLQVLAPDFSSGGQQVLPNRLWTSQQASSTSAYRITTLSGSVFSDARISNEAVRPIRKVPVSI